jgi:hydrogenase maturation protein HypF
MMLESTINPHIHTAYPVENFSPISLKGIIDGIIKDIHQNESVSNISARFHNSIIQIIIKQAKHIRDDHNINKIVLSGGCFQNAYILSKLEKRLANEDFKVYSHSVVPANDSCIALGQLAITAKRRTLCV